MAFLLTKNGNSKKQAWCNALPKQLGRSNLRKMEFASMNFDDSSKGAITSVITQWIDAYIWFLSTTLPPQSTSNLCILTIITVKTTNSSIQEGLFFDCVPIYDFLRYMLKSWYAAFSKCWLMILLTQPDRERSESFKNCISPRTRLISPSCLVDIKLGRFAHLGNRSLACRGSWM